MWEFLRWEVIIMCTYSDQHAVFFFFCYNHVFVKTNTFQITYFKLRFHIQIIYFFFLQTFYCFMLWEYSEKRKYFKQNNIKPRGCLHMHSSYYLFLRDFYFLWLSAKKKGYGMFCLIFLQQDRKFEVTYLIFFDRFWLWLW